LVTAVDHFLTDPSLKAELQVKGREHAKYFIWEKTARDTLDVLKSCL
jgi:hypothetical protein